MASLRIDHHLWHEGDVFRAGIWMLNDAPAAMEGGKICVSYALGDGDYIHWGAVTFPETAEQSNICCGEMAFTLPMGFEGKIRIKLAVEGHKEMDSEYTYLCRTRWRGPTKRLLNF